MSFELIAIEVLEGCDTAHSKNLRYNSPYRFLKNYKITKEKGSEVIEVPAEKVDLYSHQKRLKVNISAIVGKNGSGKSTIVDLLIKSINNFFYQYRKNHPEREFHDVELVSGIAVNVFFKTQEGMFRLQVISDKGDKEAKEKKITCTYKIFKFSFDDRLGKYTNSTETTEDFGLKQFFYSEVINYSLYAYNSKIEGSWISKIFHKNDAYQTPVVLNPYREEGVIDINLENDLVFQRLLSNLLRFDEEKKLNLDIGDNLVASNLIMSLSDADYYIKKAAKDFSVNLMNFTDEYKADVLKTVLKAFQEEIPIKKWNSEILYLSKLYILYKLISICHKYLEYKKGKYFNLQTKEFNDLDGLVENLQQDHSHITFKLRQTINFLIHDHIPFDLSQGDNKVNLQEVANNIQKIIRSGELIHFLPPPIFKIELELTSLKSTTAEIPFSSLSSGEKQLIYSINSIFYHLLNLDSIHHSTDPHKVAYNHINIVLEEIELYFHPEFQRTYIDRLLYGIDLLKLKNIQGINLLFVTHSPFVLSDIPSSNIMYLSLDEEGFAEDHTNEKTKTFSANIHHLLRDNFFFSNSLYIGEFANNKIKEVINFIKQNNRESEIQYYMNIVELIDEPILKSKLLEMIYERYPDYYEQKKKMESQRMVKAYADKLGVEISIDG